VTHHEASVMYNDKDNVFVYEGVGVVALSDTSCKISKCGVKSSETFKITDVQFSRNLTNYGHLNYKTDNITYR
jgi:hypothetical protein